MGYPPPPQQKTHNKYTCCCGAVIIATMYLINHKASDTARGLTLICES